MPITCLTINHTHAPIAVRESLHVPEASVCAALQTLRDEALIAEGVLLCTCNRTELYFRPSDPPDTELPRRVLDGLVRLTGAPAPPPECALTLQGEAAVRHLFRVAAGLESRVLGENEILGQVKTAYRLACEAGTNGFYTNALFHRAFRAGKRVRARTESGAGSSSAGNLAVEDAARRMGGLTGRRALVIGSGEMADRVLQTLEEHALAELAVLSRNRARACALAGRHRADAQPLDRLPAALMSCDVVFCATASPDYLITPEMLSARPAASPLWIYDLAMPRDADPALGNLPGISLIDLDAITPGPDSAETDRILYETGIKAAESIIEMAVDGYTRWLCELHAVPSIQRLLALCENARRAEVARAAVELPPEETHRLEKLARRLSQRLMNDIIEELKRTARVAAGSRNSSGRGSAPGKQNVGKRS